MGGKERNFYDTTDQPPSRSSFEASDAELWPRPRLPCFLVTQRVNSRKHGCRTGQETTLVCGERSGSWLSCGVLLYGVSGLATFASDVAATVPSPGQGGLTPKKAETSRRLSDALTGVLSP
jgi:hypothetical protein